MFYIALGVIIGIIIGCIIIYIILMKKLNENTNALNEKQLLLGNMEEKHNMEKSNLLNTARMELDKQIMEKDRVIFEVNTRMKSLEEKYIFEKEKFEKLDKEFTEKFKAIANEIIVSKSKEMTERNKENINSILDPFKENIKEFKEIIQITNKENIVTNTNLMEKIKNIETLGSKMSDETHILTKALKSEVKYQGNWGEFILERILENSGLKENIDYIKQAKGLELTDDENNRLRPDIIILLPQEKNIVIDSKVSLISVERYINAIDAKDKEKHLKEIEVSIKNHIDGLSKKNYSNLNGINSPDFVLMFIPIESVLSVLIEGNSDIFSEGIRKKVVMVTPSTLLATLWTVAYIWQQENQRKNIKEIADIAGKLYDKFALFLNTFTEIGDKLDKSKEVYNKAIGQLNDGKGSIMSQAEKIKDLGANTTKELNLKLFEKNEI